MAEYGCKVKHMQEFVQAFLKDEEYCGVCRRNFNEIIDHLEQIREGRSSREALDLIRQLAGRVSNMCQCGKGRQEVQKVLDMLTEAVDEFIVHIENRVCPSAECPKLVLAPCQAACPAGIDIPNYVALVGYGRHEDAVKLIKEDIPLPGSLGRICEHPCQSACRRGEVDSPIAICALKRVAYDKASNKDIQIQPPEVKNGQKVAVVGAGPAGLSAAYFLAQRGYSVTIFEAMPDPGGMLAYGIPPYRLPREVLWDEIANVKAMGVEIRLNSPISGEYGIDVLKKEGYAAVFLGTGAWKGSIPIQNAEEYEGVMDGVTFLRTVNHGLNRESDEKGMDLSGEKVVVVGGGNVAIDAARVSLRLGAKEVRMVYRRTREEMPALNEEIVDAEKEGVIFNFLVSPVHIGGKNGKVSHIECLQNTLSEPDASGRCKPVPVKDSEYEIEADRIIFATGQQPDVAFLDNKAQGTKVEVSRNRIVVNPDTMETGCPGVFAGGDAVTGPASAVKAIGAGKRAAASIDAYLRGEKPSAGIKYPVKRKSIAPIQVSAEEKGSDTQIDFHDLYVSEKMSTFEEIMLGVSDAAAEAEAKRCLRCDMCIACGSCADNCREQVGADAIKLGYIKEDEEAETDFKHSEDNCIGCATCSVNCPTGAITCEDKDGFREMRMCGSMMSRLQLVPCKECGRSYTTEKHLEYVNWQLTSMGTLQHNKDICPDCARKKWSQNVFGVRIS